MMQFPSLNTVNRLAQAGVASALIVLSLAVFRYIVDAYAGRYPDLFSTGTPLGAVWWAAFVFAFGFAAVALIGVPAMAVVRKAIA